MDIQERIEDFLNESGQSNENKAFSIIRQISLLKQKERDVARLLLFSGIECFCHAAIAATNEKDKMYYLNRAKWR